MWDVLKITSAAANFRDECIMALTHVLSMVAHAATGPGEVSACGPKRVSSVVATSSTRSLGFRGQGLLAQCVGFPVPPLMKVIAMRVTASHSRHVFAKPKGCLLFT